MQRPCQLFKSDQPTWKKPNSLSQPVDQTRQIFAHLSEKQKQLLHLDALVRPIFHTHASMNVSVAYYDNEILTIATESLTAANHLNYLSSLFLPKLQSLPELHELKSLSFICIEQLKPKKTQNIDKKQSINSKSRELLKKSASIIRDNPELSHALHQLSNKK